MDESSATSRSTSWMVYQEKMGNMLVTFLVSAAVLLMVAMAILVLVYLTTKAEEKEYTREDEMNRDIADLLDSRDASGAVKDVDTTTETPKPSTTRRSPRTTRTTTTTSTKPTPSPMTVPKETTTRTTTTKKTTPKTPRKSLLSGTLLCTLAANHFSSTFVFPADGLCDIITFNSLFVKGGNTLSPPYDDDLSNFLSTASGHRITEYGIGIDHNLCRDEGRMRDLISDPATKANLDDMWSQRVHHYGQVNTPVMEAIGNPLEYVTQSARGLQMISQLMTDKAYSEDQPSQTILHYPLIYESMAADVAEALTSYHVDLLVAIGYTAYSDYGNKDCRMVPPVLHTTELLEPFLLNDTYPVRLVRVISALATFKKQREATSALAVSLGMGGRWYTPKYPNKLVGGTANSLLGQECTTSTRGDSPAQDQMSSIGEVCRQSNYNNTFQYDETFQAVFTYDKSDNMLFTHESSASLRFKLFDTEGINTDVRYSIVADNIQYEDFENLCGRGAYNRLRFLKRLVAFIGGA